MAKVIGKWWYIEIRFGSKGKPRILHPESEIPTDRFRTGRQSLRGALITKRCRMYRRAAHVGGSASVGGIVSHEFRQVSFKFDVNIVPKRACVEPVWGLKTGARVKGT